MEATAVPSTAEQFAAGGRVPCGDTAERSLMKSGICPQRYLTGAFCFLLLFSVSSLPASTPDPKPLTAVMLVARDELPDPNFSDSIVLVMNNLGPGPVGIIINRPTRMPVSHLFPDLKGLVHVPDKVYFGGPIDLESVWFLFRAAKPPEHVIQACDGVYLSSDRQLLLQLLGRDKPMDSLRIFVGHAAWAQGQLEAEIERRDWTPKRAEAQAIFSGQSEHPWPSREAPKLST